MARLLVAQGAIEISDDELDGRDLANGSLQVDCELARLVCANVVVKKKKSMLPVRWSYTLDGAKLIVPIIRGSGKRRKRRTKGENDGRVARGVLAVGDVVMWTVYGE